MSFKANKDLFIAISITFIYLLINVIIINDYGVTWDFTYHFNAGLWHLKKPLTDLNFIMGPSPPLSDTLPVLTNNLMSEKWQLLPFDAAYNLYSVILGSLGIGILYLFIKSLFNRSIALFSSLTLAFLPRYFGHLHNNMKDIPQAVFFTLSIWMLWCLLKKPSVINLLLASIAFSLAFNSKVNAIFILVTAFSYLFLTFISKYFMGNNFKSLINIKILSYFILAPLFAFILWVPFWDKPIARLLEASHSYTTSTTNMPVLYFGKIFYSGQNIPWHYPFGILAVTTPILVSFFFLIGFVTLFNYKKFLKENRLFILLWFLVPLSRYLKPQMIVIDDIRHFMEVVFPFTVISGIGVYRVIELLNGMRMRRITTSAVSLFVLYLVYQILSYHPFQTSYFSEIVGGIKGAQRKFDIEFWASAYKPALQYLNQYAPENSKIIIAMAPDIAKLYLRPDLTVKLNQKNLAGADSKIYSQSDYTVILNRQSFFNWYGISAYMKKNQPIYTLSKFKVPLVYFFKN